MKGTTFELTADHVKLLRAAFVRWEDCETGAPAIDCKRPYGNSYVPADVAEELSWDVIDDSGHLSREDEARALELHKQTETALQIVLSTGSFEPGVYIRSREYDDRSWRRV